MPTLDPYPGESLEYYEAYAGPDNNLYGDLYYRDSGGHTLASGDVWKVWYRSDWQVANRYLDDPGADVIVSWVLEVTAGSGTIVASEGIDPDYGDPDATAPTPLGTFTITGAGAYAIPSVLMDAAYIVDGDDTCLIRLECTSGSIDVQQAKIRVWPPGGPRGGPVDLPSWNTTASIPGRYRSAHIASNGEDAASYEDAWDLSSAAIIGAEPIGTHEHISYSSTNPSGPSAEVQGLGRAEMSLVTIGVYTAGHYISTETLLLLGQTWVGRYPISDDLEEGVDWVRHPNEIDGDAAAVEQLGAGSTAWSGETSVAWSTADEDIPYGAATLETAALDDVPITTVNLGLGFFQYYYDLYLTGGTDISGTGTTALPTSGNCIVVSMSHSYLQRSEDWPGPGASGGGFDPPDIGRRATAVVDGLMTYAVMPPYRLWLHTAPAASRTPLQWNQRPDQLGREGAALWRADLTGHHRAQWRGTI